MESLSMSSIDRIARDGSLRERVTASLRDAILNGELKPGQKLVERELCARLAISRTLLREALPQLQAEGLIRCVAHKGPSVASVDADEAKSIYAVRRALEGLAAQEFACNASDELVDELRAQLIALQQPEAASSLRNLLVAKTGFYSVLYKGCGNPVLSQILTQLNNRIMLYKRLSLTVTGRLARAIEELEAVVAAIEARDPDSARELCEIHVRNAERNVMLKLSDQSDALADEHDGTA